MDTFILLLLKVLPLYSLILLGYIAGRVFKISREGISTLLIYIVAPFVIFSTLLNTEIDTKNILLPILFFCLTCITSLTFLKISGKIWSDSNKNVLAFTSGTGNVGYFGIPVASAIFGDEILGIVMLILLGFSLYESTLGFYLIARGSFTVKMALRRVLTLPAMYAFFLGLILSLLNINYGEGFNTFVLNFKSVYTVLGMMLIGMGVSSITKYKLDFKFVGISFLAKFVVWPILVFLIVYIDSTYLNIWTDTIHKAMIFMSIVPLAANTVVYATQLKTEPEKAAFAVILSTLFALFFIPIVVGLVNTYL